MECISVQRRDVAVKPKKLRRAGVIPAVVFGKAVPESISIQLDEKTTRRLIRTKREGSKLELDIEGERIPVQIKEKRLNLLNHEIEHMSFQTLTRGEKVNSVIHIILANDDKISGTLERMLLEIPYASLPRDMIDTITVDLDGIKAGTIITVQDIPELMSDKIELKVDPESICCVSARENSRRLSRRKLRNERCDRAEGQAQEIWQRYSDGLIPGQNCRCI